PELSPRGQEDDWNRARGRIAEQLFRHLPAVDSRDHHVQQDNIRMLLAGKLEPGPSVRRLEHLHPLGLEIDAAEQPDGRLVVDDEDAGQCATSSCSAGSARAAVRAAGSSITKVDPSPSTDSSLI